MTGTEDASVCVQTERGGLLGAVTVAWIACDGAGFVTLVAAVLLYPPETP